MKSKAQTSASIAKMELNIDCELCGKPIEDGNKIITFNWGTFQRVNMQVHSDKCFLAHQECFDNMQIKKVEP